METRSARAVSQGHPDKVADKIADSIVDAFLKADPASVVNCDVTLYGNQVHIFGNACSRAEVDMEAIARKVIRDIGYVDPALGFTYKACSVHSNMTVRQVDEDTLRTLPDFTVGYACRESEALMPLPLEIAHLLVNRLDYIREMRLLPEILPDSIVSVSMTEKDSGPEIASIVFGMQRIESITEKELYSMVMDEVVQKAIPADCLKKGTQVRIDTERFIHTGGLAHSGMSGRQRVTDLYGSGVGQTDRSHSGRDGHAFQRCGTYLARFLARNLVADGASNVCGILVSTSGRCTEPFEVSVGLSDNTESAHAWLDEHIRNLDLSVEGVCRMFQLERPLYASISCYGQIGSYAAKMPWEQPYAQIIKA